MRKIIYSQLRPLVLLSLVILLFITNLLAGEDITVGEDSKRSSLIVLPIISYTPETRLAGGLMMNLILPGKTAQNRPSSFLPSFIYTQNKQVSAEISGLVNWRNDRYKLSGYAAYQEFPDKFYGIGPSTSENAEEDYVPRRVKFDLHFQWRVLPATWTGFSFDYEYSKLRKVEDYGQLAMGSITGSGSGSALGLGLSLSNDTRDNVFSPALGRNNVLTVQMFNKTLGGDYDYTRLNLDLRYYIPVKTDQVLALNGYFNLLTGDPPFQRMSLLGEVGDYNLLRGYYQGRYRDYSMYALQAEYRLPVWWRFRAVVFAGIGDVAHQLNRFRLRTLKISGGGGIRFALNPEARLNLRLDYGLTPESNGLYLSIGEAF
ncbi:MAG: BamA/TamA family outer membrane protein [Candidatus Cloacimonetes bacterium]|nr:BamA/TamA family outer membrane protein [Candidatus Cloacimonadota bacterium]